MTLDPVVNSVFGMIPKGRRFRDEEKSGSDPAKDMTLASPSSNPASAPVARKSLVKLSDDSGSPLARLLPLHLWLAAPADIAGQLVEPDRHREQQEFACETGQRPRAPFSFFKFLPHDPIREAI